MSPDSEVIPGMRDRFADVRRRIGTAAREVGRSPESVKLIAITKTHPVDVIRQAIENGASDFGENRVQEAEPKIAQLGHVARWHLVGHLQTNKARRAVKLFDCIHSVDSSELAQRLDRLCVEAGKASLEVLVQLDLGGEATKSGIDPAELPGLLGTITQCERLRLIGLMTLPPFFENPDCSRPFFKTLRELRDRLQAEGHFKDGCGELSMGMSHDFEVAISEGATMVRVGTALFGTREQQQA